MCKKIYIFFSYIPDFSHLLSAVVTNNQNGTTIEEPTIVQPTTAPPTTQKKTKPSSEFEITSKKTLFKKSVESGIFTNSEKTKTITTPTHPTLTLNESIHTFQHETGDNCVDCQLWYLLTPNKTTNKTQRVNKIIYTTTPQKESVDTAPTYNATTARIQIFKQAINGIYKTSTNNIKTYTAILQYETTNPTDTKDTKYATPTLTETTNTILTHSETKYVLPTHNEINTTLQNDTVYTKPKEALYKRSKKNESTNPILTQNETVYTLSTDNEANYTVPKRNGTIHKITTFMTQLSKRPAYNKTVFSIPKLNDTVYTIPTHNELSYTVPKQNLTVLHKIQHIKNRKFMRKTYQRPPYKTIPQVFKKIAHDFLAWHARVSKHPRKKSVLVPKKKYLTFL